MLLDKGAIFYVNRPKIMTVSGKWINQIVFDLALLIVINKQKLQ